MWAYRTDWRTVGSAERHQSGGHRLSGHWAEHACGNGGLLTLAATASAAFPGSNGQIAFNGSFFIFTMQPDGTGFTQLTHTNGPSTGFLDRAPAWSADGSRIAFESDSQADRQHEQGLRR